MMIHLGWLLMAAAALSGCEKQEPAKPPATTPKADPAKPRTVEERIADLLALGPEMSDERIQHEQALSKYLHQPPYDQFLADFHSLLLKDDQTYVDSDSHAKLLKTLVSADTRPGVIGSILQKHFSACHGYTRSQDGRGMLRRCRQGTGRPGPDPAKGCKEYLALVLPSLVGLDQLEEKARGTQKDLLPLVEQFTGKKKEEFSNDVFDGLLPLVQKHRPDAYDKLISLINGIKAESRTRKQDFIRAELRGLHRNELRHFVQGMVGDRRHEYWTGDAGSILNPPQLEERVSSGKPYDSGAYRISPLLRDAKGAPYGQDSDGSGKPWGNKEGFAYVAVPKEYPVGGRQTYLINETGTIWSMDTGGKGIEVFPGNLDTDGWTVAEKPVPEDNLASVQLQYGLENDSLDEMRGAVAAMRKRGEDPRPLLFSLLRQQYEVRNRILGLCVAEFESTEDAAILGVLEGLCEEVYETSPMVEAVKKIAPKGYPAWVGRLRDRLLKSENALHRENLARTLASAMEKSEAKALEDQLLGEAGLATKEGKPARAVERYTIWVALHRSDTLDESARILRLRARAYLLTKDREAAKSDVEAAGRDRPPASPEDIELEEEFPEIAFQSGLEHDHLDEMQAALAAMRKRGVDPHPLLSQLILQRGEGRERDRILSICGAEFQATEDAAILSVLEDLCKNVSDAATIVEASKKIAPKGYPAWVGRLRDRLLKSEDSVHRGNLVRILASEMEKSEVKALQVQLAEQAERLTKEGQPYRVIERYTTWIALHRSESQDEVARILRLRARAYLLTQDREAAKSDVEAARKAKPPATAEDVALEKEFPEIVPERAGK